MKHLLAAVIAVIVLALAGGTTAYRLTTDNAAAGTSANLWVDTSGGSCSRSGSPTDYSDAAACPSLDAAYDAAQCGDLVLVKGGTYGSDQNITGDNSCGAGHEKLLQAAAGELPSFPYIGNPGKVCPASGPDWLVLRGFKLRYGINVYGWSHATIDQMDGGSFSVSCSQSTTIENSDWGPCTNTGGNFNGQPADCRNFYRGDALQGQNRISQGAIDTLLLHNTIHDFICLDCSANGAHFEGIQIWQNPSEGGPAFSNLTIDGNKFYDMWTNAISMGVNANLCAGAVHIQNNWFGQPFQFHYPLNITSYPMNCDIYVQNNSFVAGYGFWCEGGCGSGGGSGHDYSYGNIFGTAGANGQTSPCGTGFTCDYNVFLAGSSGPTGSHPTILTSLPYVNGNGLSAMDYHLSGSNIQGVDNVVGMPCVGDDFDGGARSVPCDAGADERDNGGGGTTTTDDHLDDHDHHFNLHEYDDHDDATAVLFVRRVQQLPQAVVELEVVRKIESEGIGQGRELPLRRSKAECFDALRDLPR